MIDVGRFALRFTGVVGEISSGFMAFSAVRILAGVNEKTSSRFKSAHPCTGSTCFIGPEPVSPPGGKNAGMEKIR